jgi:hypothetical protein
VPFSRDNPRFAQGAAVQATAEALIQRLERAARNPAEARAIVAAVLAARATDEERPALARVVAGTADHTQLQGLPALPDSQTITAGRCPAGPSG